MPAHAIHKVVRITELIAEAREGRTDYGRFHKALTEPPFKLKHAKIKPLWEQLVKPLSDGGPARFLCLRDVDPETASRWDLFKERLAEIGIRSGLDEVMKSSVEKLSGDGKFIRDVDFVEYAAKFVDEEDAFELFLDLDTDKLGVVALDRFKVNL